MFLHMGAFGQIDRSAGVPGYKDACHQAFLDFSAWRKLQKIACSQKKFNYYGIFNESYGTFLNLKGFNARVVGAWLLDVCERLVRSDWPVPGSPRTLGKHAIHFWDERLHLCHCALSLGLKT